ncbi:NADPH:quinone reductase [Rhodohalobacter sp. 614A]|uniref:NADPH:quinone reductase n=1 Tax=Rhodohalobacter sp. 614A TaxID=2908649 RepID=UPI001F209790|nr:NADPH:quinone reductase [Rhodohalobacter sp. 614A]
MKAAWYERQGPADEVLIVGEQPVPEPKPGEVRIKLRYSGINPGDIKKRQDAFDYGMPYPLVIPHSDGAGIIDRVGENVAEPRVGERVWCYGAQSYRPFGTAAEYVVVPSDQAISLPENVSFEQGACLGIPGITAHRAVHIAGDVQGKTVLVQGGRGAVGQCAVALAKFAGANVIATVRSEYDKTIARKAGADEVIRTDHLSQDKIIKSVRNAASGDIHHIIEVAFDSNIEIDKDLISTGGSIAAYATANPEPSIPFWPLLFKNVRLYFLGSDDFPKEAKVAATKEINQALVSGWKGLEIGNLYELNTISEAHKAIENGFNKGQVILKV